MKSPLLTHKAKPVIKSIFNYAFWPAIAGLLIAYIITNHDIGRHAGPHSYASAVSKASISVVNIYTKKKVPRPHPYANHPKIRAMLKGNTLMQLRLESSLGSGVVVSSDGYILTNNHVIADATQIVVLLADGRESPATIIGTDSVTDLAVIKIELDNLHPINLGKPSEAFVGDVVMAIGNPFGVGQTVTQGIISATGRYNVGLNAYDSFLQTDAAINPGNSGGALIDANGDLLGINTAVLDGTNNSVGISFAIPADTAINVMNEILETGTVTRGWLGFQADLVQTEGNLGLFVTEVTGNGPAYVAGIQPGDVIIKMGELSIENTRESLAAVAALAPGEQLDLTIARAQETYNTSIRVGIKP